MEAAAPMRKHSALGIWAFALALVLVILFAVSIAAEIYFERKNGTSSYSDMLEIADSVIVLCSFVVVGLGIGAMRNSVAKKTLPALAIGLGLLPFLAVAATTVYLVALPPVASTHRQLTAP